MSNWQMADLVFLAPISLAFLTGIACRRWIGAVVAAVLIAILQLVLITIALSVGELSFHFELVALILPPPIVASLLGHGLRRLSIWAAISWQRTLAALAGSGLVLLGGFFFGTERLVPVLPHPWSEFALLVAKSARPACTLASAAEVDVPELPVFETPSAENVSPPRTELLPQFANLPVIKHWWKNFIGPEISIRDPQAYHKSDDLIPNVLLEVVVDQGGSVIDVAARSGPMEHFQQALAIARTWKFDPFEIYGRPTTVRVNGVGVRIDVPALRQPRNVSPDDTFDLSTVSIQYQIRPGFGGLQYDLLIRGDGTVTYDGDSGVALMGRHCARLPKARVARLAEEFRKVKFNSLADEYDGQGSDGYAEYVTFSAGGRTKTVRLYMTDYMHGVEDGVRALPRFFSYVVQSDRWTIGNRFTAASLLAEHWDFSRSDHDNLGIVPGIAAEGDESTLRQVIKAGARVSPDMQGFSPMYPGLTSLEIAARRSNLAMVQILLETPTRWNVKSLSSALADVSGLGHIGTIRTLISRGANPDFRDPKTKKSPLVSASIAGVPGIVELLLKSGADANLKGEYDRSPLHWAVTWLKADDPVLPGADRATVAKLLLKAGADANARDDDGNTPLMSEWLVGADAAPVLIAHGADVNAHDFLHEHTAVMVCKNPKVTQMLLEAGADPYAKDVEGRTALDIAKGTEVAKVLQAWMSAHPKLQ